MLTILLSRSDEEYLQKCALELRFTYGIIIGQRAEPQKYVVVHLAKNSEDDADLNDSHDSGKPSVRDRLRIQDIDIQALASQWVSAAKMIPGSFMVLGAFVTGVKPDVIADDTFKYAKNLFTDSPIVQRLNNLIGFAESHPTEYIFLAYSTANKKVMCKMYSHGQNGGSFTPMECRFVEKRFEWYTFECNYELDDIFPILDNSPKINIEQQFQHSIDAVKLSLAASEIFIQQEHVENSLSLDVYVKKKYPKLRGQPDDSFKVTIFLPVKCQISSGQAIKVREFNGTIRFAGVVSSRVWCNPKNTLGDVKRFVRDDILRSLAARVQVYCDGLTDPNISNEVFFISEPPRRVYFNLPGDSASHPIQFSDYIFRGETPTVAVAQAKTILDLDIDTNAIVADLEGLAEDEAFSDTSSELQILPSETEVPTFRDLSRTMYMLGIVVSMLVLLISVMLHYFLQE